MDSIQVRDLCRLARLGVNDVCVPVVCLCFAYIFPCLRLLTSRFQEFELGLEMDSAEVRGILLYEGQEWGRVVFDFLN